MKVIKVGDLRDLAKETSSEEYIETDIIIAERPVIVKRYIPIEDKISILTSFYTGIYNSEHANSTVAEVLRKIKFIKTYTNINLPKEDLEAYNILVMTGIFDKVVEQMNQVELKELLKIESLVLKDIEEKETNNQIVETLAGLIPSEDSTRQLIEDAKLAVDDMDSDKLREIRNTLGVM